MATAERSDPGWRCAVCSSENPLEADACTVCGASFAKTMLPDVAERPSRDPNKVAMLSLFCPGAGHAYLGNWGQAIARFVISAWVVTVALLAGIQSHSGMAWLTAILFGLVAFALWAIAAHDAYREAEGQPGAVLLKGKLFAYLVIGLLVLMMVLLVFGTVSANLG